MNRLERLTAILTHLQSKRVIKAQEIADRFQVSLRTVYRDIRALEESGVPVFGEAGTGYSLVDGYRLPPIMFTKEEALSLIIAEKVFEKITQDEITRDFQAAMLKIKAILKQTEKNTLSDIYEQIEVYTRRTGRDLKSKETRMQIILDCLSAKKVIQLNYTSFENEERNDRMVEPVGIYFSHEKWYLIAWCRLRSDYRTFRLDRINTIKGTEEVYRNTHISLKEYLDSIEKKENLIRVVIEVPKKLVKYIKEQRFQQGFVMENEFDDKIQMSFMSSSLESFLWWILPHTDYIKIIEPKELKNKLNGVLKKMLEKNS
jgi:predicted DNA-binding transcriptional regulator YafY